jgi:hypothetical protein
MTPSSHIGGRLIRIVSVNRTQFRGRLRAGPTISAQHAGATYACLSLVIVVSATPAKLLANR